MKFCFKSHAEALQGLHGGETSLVTEQLFPGAVSGDKL